MKTFNLSLADIIGLIGVFITLLAYLLLSIRKIDANRWPYPALNALGSLLIIYSLFYHWNLSAWIMELSWLILSVYSIFRALQK